MSVTILCYGDSNTYGFNPENGLRYPRDVRWPGRMRLVLGDEYHVIEEGCNGRCAAGIDAYEPWKYGLDYLRPCLNSHKPVDILILMLGSNDLKSEFGFKVSEIAEKVAHMVDVAKEFMLEKQGFEPEIILVSPPHATEGVERGPFGIAFDSATPARSRKFAPYYRQIAEERGCIFFDAAEYIEPSDTDHLHLSAEAHIKLGEELAKVVRSMDGKADVL